MDDLEHLTILINWTQLICARLITPILCLIGFISNCLNILVLTRSWMTSSTNVYLTAVAVCDLHYLLFSWLFSLWTYDGMRRIAFYMYLHPVIFGTANLFSNTTTWLTVCFTLERYIAISSPILGRQLCTQTRARLIVILTVIFSFIFTFPDYLKKKTVFVGKQNATDTTHQDNVSSKTGMYHLKDTEIQGYLSKYGYDYFNQIIFVFIPIILLVIFNSLLIRSVLKAHKSRRTLVKHVGSTRTTVDFEMSTRYCDLVQGQLDEPEPVVREALHVNDKTNTGLTCVITRPNSQRSYGRITSTTNSRKPILGEQQRITLMLITIVIAFIVLQLPSTVPTIIMNFWKSGLYEKTERQGKILKIYADISNLLLILNAAMNFVFYSLFSAKFRHTCCILFKTWRCCTWQSFNKLKTGVFSSSSSKPLQRPSTTKSKQLNTVRIKSGDSLSCSRYSEVD